MNDNYIKDFIHAGSLASQVRSYGKTLIQIGSSYNDVIAKINQKTISLGGRAAFPPQMALNHVAAHYLPHPGEDIIFSNEIIKLDVGVCYNGAIGDCAVTIDLSGKYQKLIDAAEAALLAAERTIQVGLPIAEIGRVIENTIASFGMNSIKNLSGHGLGRFKVHTPPSIPNYNDKSTAVIKPGMTFAIEPFSTDGKGLIHETGDPTIFSFAKARLMPSSLGRSILKKITEFNGLPFAIHSLSDEEISIEDAKKTVCELLKFGVIVGHAPLVETTKGMVAQAENSVLVDKNGKVHITTRSNN
jgi:methionyl aminopeptidase